MPGWKVAKKLLRADERIKSDERILGDSEFVQGVLARCNEHYPRRHRWLIAQGVDLKSLARGVADFFEVSVEQMFTPGRSPVVVQARSMLCYLAVRELGVTATELARQMGLTQPAISLSVKRGEAIARQKQMAIDDFLP
jgi:REP-associated tyrosine transposase